MEKKLKYIFLLLTMFGYFTIQAQELSVPAIDPKLTPEQGGPGQTVTGNQAKPPVNQIDSRISTINPSGLQQYGGTDPKPADLPKDTKLNADGTLPSSTQGSKSEVTIQAKLKKDKEQPVAPDPGNITNYRNIKGPKEQPKPEVSGKVTNYREISGPKEQPIGSQPKK
jgi:hypothetical protein